MTFYMRHSHAEISRAISQSLETFLRAAGADALGLYVDEAGDWQLLDDAGWSVIRDALNHPRSAYVDLTDASDVELRYRFTYTGKRLDPSFLEAEPDATSAVSFWLPTEYLEEHGPERVRNMAIELASALPFCSGNVGLSFNCDLGLMGVAREVRKLWMRYPGMDLPLLHWNSLRIGAQVHGPSWLTFLGQPVLGELGGTKGLQARLRSPRTTVQAMEGNRGVVTLGAWPEAGDTQQAQLLPEYRELAHVLEPWLFRPPSTHGENLPPDEFLRWERRFLD
ncbi:MAG TPA: DUF3396 domain-containing protein [Archangium sp.]|nr:DUF3396 domain-containing protein [Archangium sp.]